jgi:SAM-dependent methyltransferase
LSRGGAQILHKVDPPAERPPLPERIVERIRRERYAPRITQCDYLHLRDLRSALAEALERTALPPGPALDVYCGTQPYREMISARAVWGLDLDRHFGRTDVVGAVPLPFRDGAFSLVLCTQALHLVDDPLATVHEMRRVLAPGGMAIVTVPHIFRRELTTERKLSAEQLRGLFSGWDVEVKGVGGLGSALAYYPASLANGAARRWPALRAALPPLGLTLNAAGSIADLLLRPFAQRWPASWIVVARPTSKAGARD